MCSSPAVLAVSPSPPPPHTHAPTPVPWPCMQLVEFMKEHVLPRAYALSCSPLLQGDALLSLQEYLKTLLRLSSPHLKFSSLLDAIFAAYKASVGDDTDTSSGYGAWVQGSA